MFLGEPHSGKKTYQNARMPVFEIDHKRRKGLFGDIEATKAQKITVFGCQRISAAWQNFSRCPTGIALRKIRDGHENRGRHDPHDRADDQCRQETSKY